MGAARTRTTQRHRLGRRRRTIPVAAATKFGRRDSHPEDARIGSGEGEDDPAVPPPPWPPDNPCRGRDKIRSSGFALESDAAIHILTTSDDL